jgi:ketosteroid isomerase-like protein
MRYVTALGIALAASLSGATAAQPAADVLRQQVREAERSFASSMAARDFKSFGDLVADEAVFFGTQGAQRGKAAVLAAWKPYFDGPAATFSWEPDVVEVLDSGTLALSSGPVKDPNGKQTGVFNSIWRREPGGRWKVVFDRGSPACNGPTGF